MVLMITKARVKPNTGAIDRALACAILSRVDGISIHTKKALESISRRLLDGEPVSHDEWRRTACAFFAVQDKCQDK
jgi:hypothetical protein